MGADFYPDLMNSDLWPITDGQRIEIAPLRGQTLRRAIQQPAVDKGVNIEEDLLERLIRDAADEPGALPLMQETMVLLWEKIKYRFLPLKVYEQLGSEGRSGLAVAMATKADATLANLSSVQQTMTRRIFLRLVQFGEGRADTRRQQPLAALRSSGDEPQLFDPTVRHLTENRLLTLSSEEGDQDRNVDIAHEALIAGWPTLKKWLAERRGAEQSRRRLESKVAEWVRLGRGSSGLLDEAALRDAESWLVSPDADDLGYSEDLPELVKTSRRSQQEQIEQQRKIARLKVGFCLFLGLAFAAFLSVLFLSAQREAKHQTQLAQQRKEGLEKAEISAKEQQRLRLISLVQALAPKLYANRIYTKRKELLCWHGRGIYLTSGYRAIYRVKLLMHYVPY
jgi:hypothetical protein